MLEVVLNGLTMVDGGRGIGYCSAKGLIMVLDCLRPLGVRESVSILNNVAPMVNAEITEFWSLIRSSLACRIDGRTTLSGHLVRLTWMHLL